MLLNALHIVTLLYTICKITIFDLIGKITQNKFNNNYIEPL